MNFYIDVGSFLLGALAAAILIALWQLNRAWRQARQDAIDESFARNYPDCNQSKGALLP